MKKILFVFGTRPEAIKMAPLIKELEKHSKNFEVKTCITAQHRQMLDQVISFFEIKIDYDLNLMLPNQTLFDITSKGLKELEEVLTEFSPHLVIVQGDTTTAFVGALAAFYKRIKIAHLEAGLRSYDKYSPYPEEINRILVSRLADLHFAPTKSNLENLTLESIINNVWVVGNTVIDALHLGLSIIKNKGEEEYRAMFNNIDFSKKVMLVTIHRRESFGAPFHDLCKAIKDIAIGHPEVEIVYPVHLNPNINGPANEILKDIKNVHLLKPLDYPYLIWLLNKSFLILTDSGGIQEEAPSLGKPVLVLREVTERMEGVESGTAKLLGVDKAKIVEEVRNLISSSDEYNKMSKAINPYGDGSTSRKIVDILIDKLF